MKYFIYSFIALLLAFSVNSCSTDEDEELGLDTSPNTFVANFEGETWTAVKKEAILTNNYLTVYGEASDNSLITLKMELYNNEPTGKAYILSNAASHYAVYDNTTRIDSLVYWSKNNYDDFEQSGDIELVKLSVADSLVSGTFKFRAFNNHLATDYFNFSQGAFTDVSIVDILTIDVTGQNDINNGGDDDNGDGDGGDDNGGDDNGGTDDQNFVNCVITGSPLVASFAYNSTTEDITTNSLYKVVSSAGLRGVTIEFLTTIEVGSYDLSAGNDYMIQMKYSEGTQVYVASSSPVGTLVITEKTAERISGTFSGELEHLLNSSDQRQLANGSFSFAIQ